MECLVFNYPPALPSSIAAAALAFTASTDVTSSSCFLKKRSAKRKKGEGGRGLAT